MEGKYAALSSARDVNDFLNDAKTESPAIQRRYSISTGAKDNQRKRRSSVAAVAASLFRRRSITKSRSSKHISENESDGVFSNKEKDEEEIIQYMKTMQLDTTIAYPGSVFGLQHLFVQGYSMDIMDSIVALDVGYVGFFEKSTLEALFTVDKRLKRLLQQNYHRHVMDGIKTLVPMLTDMEASFYDKMCRKLVLSYIPREQVIYQEGRRGDSCFLIIQGAVKVIIYVHTCALIVSMYMCMYFVIYTVYTVYMYSTHILHV